MESVLPILSKMSPVGLDVSLECQATARARKGARFVVLFVFLTNELSCQDFWVEKDRTR